MTPPELVLRSTSGGIKASCFCEPPSQLSSPRGLPLVEFSRQLDLMAPTQASQWMPVCGYSIIPFSHEPKHCFFPETEESGLKGERLTFPHRGSLLGHVYSLMNTLWKSCENIQEERPGSQPRAEGLNQARSPLSCDGSQRAILQQSLVFSHINQPDRLRLSPVSRGDAGFLSLSPLLHEVSGNFGNESCAGSYPSSLACRPELPFTSVSASMSDPSHRHNTSAQPRDRHLWIPSAPTPLNHLKN